MIESIPLLGESTTIISSPPLEEKYYRESVGLYDQEIKYIPDPITDISAKEYLEEIPVDEKRELSIFMQVTSSEDLTDTQKSALNRLKNTINDHLTDMDFSGTLRDLQAILFLMGQEVITIILVK